MKDRTYAEDLEAFHPKALQAAGRGPERVALGSSGSRKPTRGQLRWQLLSCLLGNSLFLAE